MFDELSDDTVVLRPVSLADVDDWLAGDDDEQTRWFEFPRRATRDDVVGAVERWQESWRARGPVRHWGIRLRATDGLAGGVEVRRLAYGSVNLSYVVFPNFRRQGLATKASRLALGYAAEHLEARAVVIKVLDGNTASLKVAAALGAVVVGEERSDAGGRFIVHRRELWDGKERG